MEHMPTCLRGLPGIHPVVSHTHRVATSGTVTTLNILGGSANFMGSAIPRTVTNLKLDAGGSLRYDPAILTITTKVNPDSPVFLSAAPG